MSNYNKTPLLQIPRQTGGTLYVFPSAHEDIGLNLNYRVNSVALSHYALLNIPTTETNVEQEATPKNHFNPTLVPGHFDWKKKNSGVETTSGWEIAASLQNYAMNFETLLLNQEDYNYSDPHTVSERVFWKWLKETGAIRWSKANSNNTYWEVIPDDEGYESVVKCFGAIDAGNSVSSEFGMFNETYVNIPTSYGGGKVFFKIYDTDTNLNYKLNHIYTCDPEHLEGRNSAISDYSYTVNYPFTDYSSDPSIESKYQTEGSYQLQSPVYITQPNYNETPDVSIDSSVEYSLSNDTTMSFLRSNLDGIEIVKDLNSIQKIFNDIYATEMPKINSYDDINIKEVFGPTDKFDFNAILLYYSVYDNNNLNRAPVATNLFGILFLDAPTDIKSSESNISFSIPVITKKKSGDHGFGTGYSFRINVKTLSVYDNTDAYINDNTTANSVLVNDFSGIVKNLNKAVENMNVNVETTKKIQQSYVTMRNYCDTLKSDVDDMSQKLDAYIAGKNTNVLNASTVFTQNIISGNTVDNQQITVSIPIEYQAVDSSESYRTDIPVYKEITTFDVSGLHTIALDTSIINTEKTFVKVKEYSGDISTYEGFADASVNEMLDAMFAAQSPSLQVNLASVKLEKPVIDSSIELNEEVRDNYYELYLSSNSSAFLDTESEFNISHLIEKNDNVTYSDSETITEVGIDYSKLVPYLIAYIQKLNARITALENQRT